MTHPGFARIEGGVWAAPGPAIAAPGVFRWGKDSSPPGPGLTWMITAALARAAGRFLPTAARRLAAGALIATVNAGRGFPFGG